MIDVVFIDVFVFIYLPRCHAFSLRECFACLRSLRKKILICFNNSLVFFSELLFQNFALAQLVGCISLIMIVDGSTEEKEVDL